MIEQDVLEKMNLQRAVLAKKMSEQRGALCEHFPVWIDFFVEMEKSPNLSWSQKRSMRGLAYSMALCYRMCLNLAHAFEHQLIRLTQEQTDYVRSMRAEDIYLRQAEDITMERFLISIDYFEDLALEIYEGRFEEIISQAKNAEQEHEEEPVLQSTLLVFFTRLRHLSNALTVYYNDKTLMELYCNIHGSSYADYKHAITAMLRCVKRVTDIPPSLMGQAFLEKQAWKLVEEVGQAT